MIGQAIRKKEKGKKEKKKKELSPMLLGPIPQVLV